MFDTVLVANRGEIAVRVMRTLREHGIRSVAVYSDADADALHVRLADAAVRIGPAAAVDSYLRVDRIVDAALASGAQAIHPGYGFLSENPALPRACAEAGVVFIGPPPGAIDAMGDKIAAKATVAAAGVSVVPGSDGTGLDDEALVHAAREVGFPVLLKPSAGGGGKGMRLVEADLELADAIESARREAASAFGDDTLLVERFVTNPRHIEIQVLADGHGNVVHLGERECSLQRRHQKIIEEAPSPLLTPVVRAEMGRQATDAARACGYRGAGTVEFIVSADRPDEFFFMEMNTRLQVEHPVTELVYGVDLVEQQLRVAAGEALPFTQADLQPNGHAIEARVYAEDAERGFLPTGGTVVGLREAVGAGVRVDSGIAPGSSIGSDYDPMLSKVIAWGNDRAEALHRLDGALASTAVLGVTTNIGFLRRLLADAEVRAGALDTGLVERRLPELGGDGVPDAALVAVMLAPLSESLADTGDPWRRLVGWRHGEAAATRREFDVPGRGRVVVLATPDRDVAAAPSWRVELDGSAPIVCSVRGHGVDRTIVVEGRAQPAYVHAAGRTTHVAVGGESWAITEVEQRGAGADPSAAHADGIVRSPMPGTVIDVAVEVGQSITAGAAVAAVEAMKMEHTLAAPFDGIVDVVHVPAGAQVGLDQPIVTIQRP
ncbi:MAG: biotin carboxylase N-terminal domain-containing protein [Ilumatobacter sp.]|uniref:ATP-binding protein n=1 Tax=Ilumatobacter sp. TaxID=1967498 RepID=UPI00262559F5|nr:biotin carboxylase N-terminal domain-containing protein [Ilumatobacter sp.]MDJ0767775.1 biotin carboxylase N-terminal domain-containing protein [Ilumatobacter sp.]